MNFTRQFQVPRVRIFDERLIRIVGGNGNNAIIQDLSSRGKKTFLVGENVAQVAFLTGDIKSSSIQTVSANGTTQGAGTLITQFIAQVTSGSDSNNSVRLQKVVELDVTYLVVNKTTVTIKCFPGSGDSINDLSADTAISILPGDMASFIVKSIS